jgi:hypothetical protein
MMPPDLAVRWEGTEESWRELFNLYDGLETVALWRLGKPLTVETANGREPVPLHARVVRGVDGVIRIELPDQPSAKP